MRFHVFESGSKGNCTLISSKGRHLLIDNGLTIRKFKAYLAGVNLTIDDIPVVLVTHSHKDHIDGLKAFNDRPRCIYSTKSTYPLYSDNNELKSYHKYELNGFHITVVPTSHDAAGSIGFIIDDGEEKLVYITDTGFIYERVVDYIRDCDYYIFESNHNVQMQLKTGRPQYLIDRIMGDHGHLSNEDAALYLSEVISSRTKEIVLAHLSEDANTPEVALETFYKIMSKRHVNVSNINVRCAKQHEVTVGGNLEMECV